MKTENQKPKSINNFLGAGFVLLVGLIAFIYRFLTNFPIGDDPAVHIYTIAHNSYGQIFSSFYYPLPLAIYKFLANLTHLPVQQLFILLVCFYLFLSALILWLLAKRITNSNIIATIGSLIFVSGLWANDGLRMGLMPESFGWLMLICTLYFVASKKFFWAIVFSLLLVFSHPYSLVIYALTFLIYAVSVLVFSEKKEKFFVLKMVGFYILAILLAYLLKPEILGKIAKFTNFEQIGWGERNFYVYFTSSQIRRIFLAIFVFVGLISSVKYLKENSYKLLFSFFLVGLFMSFNQYFGIRFQVFRFFPYLEIAIAIFAALGIKEFVSNLKLRPKYYFAGIILFTLLATIPEAWANYQIYYDQSHSAVGNNSMTMGDQKAIVWINDNVSGEAVVFAPYKRYLWIRALTNHENFLVNDVIFDNYPNTAKEIAGSGGVVYYPEIYPVPAEIENGYQKVYDKDGVRIFGGIK